MERTIYKDNKVRIRTTGRNYDFIATVENLTDSEIKIYDNGSEELLVTIPPHDWAGLLADGEGRYILRTLRKKEFCAVLAA